MKALVAALLACASAVEECANAIEEESSMMQNLVARSSSHDLIQLDLGGDVESTEARADKNQRLLEAATNMIKNGVTPDMVTFINTTNAAIEDEVLTTILTEHTRDQDYIIELLGHFDTAIATLNASRAEVEGLQANLNESSLEHQHCRADEALVCARSRRCETQLINLWHVVKRVETEMQQIHEDIHHRWCVAPPVEGSIEECTGCTEPDLCGVTLPDHVLTRCFDWADMWPYPILDLSHEVLEFRRYHVQRFENYQNKKREVEIAWNNYNAKLLECSGFDVSLDEAVAECDGLQTTLNRDSCTVASTSFEARRRFGERWAEILNDYNIAARDGVMPDWGHIRQLEFDRKREWETLRIVQCLLNHVYTSVEDSITSGTPCPNIESDPEGVALAIDDCHIVTNNLTIHLTIDYGNPPPVPPLPPVIPPPCTPGYIGREQGSFSDSVVTAYRADLAVNTPYPDDPLDQYFTVLSANQWPGCAAPLVCHECGVFAPLRSDPARNESSQECREDQKYLSPGSSNSETFRCLGSWCLSMSGRCNGVPQCGDESDEEGCMAVDGTPAYLGESFECPSDMNDNVLFRCDDSACIEKIGLCNGFDNCADGSDEGHCSIVIHQEQSQSGTISALQTGSGVEEQSQSGTISALQTGSGVESRSAVPVGPVPISTHVQLESTSGRTISLEPLHLGGVVFHDREYTIDSVGDFGGKSLVKYSNDDKETDFEHVMTKINVDEPMTVFVVVLRGKTLPWLEPNGYEQTSRTGVRYSGSRATRHTEWSGVVTPDDFDASQVWSRTFKAGTVSIPGNNGGDGGFLMFLEPA